MSGYGRLLLVINGAALLGCAVFDFALQAQLLTVLLLLLPFADKDWHLPVLSGYKNQWLWYLMVLSCTAVLLFLHPDTVQAVVYILLFTALPEEWFFRSYFMQRVQALNAGMWRANIITSLLFALLHTPAQGWQGLSVFIPSLLFGYLYQRNRDLLLVILLHTLFNTIYIIYLHDVLNEL